MKNTSTDYTIEELIVWHESTACNAQIYADRAVNGLGKEIAQEQADKFRATAQALKAQQWVSVDEVKLMLSFCPSPEQVPKGLDPTFYFTLSPESDQEIVDKITAIRQKLPQPPEHKEDEHE